MFKKIYHFWLAPISSLRLHLFQRVFTFTFLLYMGAWFLHAPEWLTEKGYHLDRFTKDIFHPSPFPLLSSTAVIPFAILLFGATLLVIFDCFASFAIWVVLGCAIYVQNVDLISAYTLNKYYIVVFALLAVSPPRYPQHKYQSAWPVRTIQSTLLIQYFTAGTCKMLHGDWLQNPQVLWSQVQGHYATDLAAYLLRIIPKEAWSIMTYGSLILELVLPIAFLFKKTRKVAMSIGIVFHTLIALLMYQLIFFSLQMISFYLLFLTEEESQQLSQRLKIQFYPQANG